MAGTSLLTLIDDIATTLDDVAIMTKVAAKKTAGVLGDDLALNAEQVTGVDSHRELPIVWAVAKGSLINKLILIPCSLFISVFVPTLIIPLLMIGGAFLCFEGFEKIYEKTLVLLRITSQQNLENESLSQTVGLGSPETIHLFEKTKIRGAVRTDFILSAEIIVITLGAVAEAPFQQQILVLCGIGLIMTVGVYGLVAAIVKIDDIGYWLIKRSAWQKKFGQCLITSAPWLMKFLGAAGTLAMFLVGGGIISHGVPIIHHWQEPFGPLTRTGIDLLVGLVTGLIIFTIIHFAQRLRK